MLAGQPVKVVALGGSVTKNHGPKREENAYLPRLFAWINETFPHPDHQFINHAIPAVSVAAAPSSCLKDLLGSLKDLPNQAGRLYKLGRSLHWVLSHIGVREQGLLTEEEGSEVSHPKTKWQGVHYGRIRFGG